MAVINEISINDGGKQIHIRFVKNIIKQYVFEFPVMISEKTTRF